MSVRTTTPSEAALLRSLFVFLHNNGVTKENSEESKFALLAFEHFKRVIKKQTQDDFYGFDRLQLLAFFLIRLTRSQLTEIFGKIWSPAEIFDFEEYNNVLFDNTCQLFDTAESVGETYRELGRLMPRTDADFTKPLFRLTGACVEDLLALTKTHTNKLSNMERYALSADGVKQKERSDRMAASVFEIHGKVIEWLIDNLPRADIPVGPSEEAVIWDNLSSVFGWKTKNSNV